MALSTWPPQNFIEIAPEEAVRPVEVQHGFGHALREGLLDALAGLALGDARRRNLSEPIP
jgi:hypothetical protein